MKLQIPSNRQGDWAWERAGEELEVSVGPDVVLSSGKRYMLWGPTRMKERLGRGMVDTRRVLVRSVLPRSWREKVTGSRNEMVTGKPGYDC